jgi:thiol-disulfide isomerase/thioredoxin
MPLRMESPLPGFKGGTDWFNSDPIGEEQLANHPVLVHFWAVSCGTCKESLPDVKRWMQEYADKGLKVISVHMPRQESDTNLDSVKEVIKDYEITQPCVVDNWHEITDSFENKYVPAFYIFDREHKMRDFKAGEKAPKMVEQALARIVGEGEGSSTVAAGANEA